jgi:hypothetical protein
MPKRNIPNYRLHKATGQAIVELAGRRFYLGKHGSKASREEYERRVAEYLGNGRKLPPTHTKRAYKMPMLSTLLPFSLETLVPSGLSMTAISETIGVSMARPVT